MSLTKPLDVSDSREVASGELGFWNKANLAANLVNVSLVLFFNAGIVGEGNDVIAQKYQVLVTPAVSSFAIWPIIFLLELIMTVGACTPTFRGNKITPAIGPFWVASCIFQPIWMGMFAFELTVSSWFAMVGILSCLVACIYKADTVEGITTAEYWCLRAPLSIHAGWVLAATGLNVNVALDSMKTPPATMLATGVVTVAVLLAINTVMATAWFKPDWGMPLILSWATYWISVELQSPERLLSPTKFNPHQWPPEVVSGMSMAAGTAALCGLFLSAYAGSWRALGAGVAQQTK